MTVSELEGTGIKHGLLGENGLNSYDGHFDICMATSSSSRITRNNIH